MNLRRSVFLLVLSCLFLTNPANAAEEKGSASEAVSLVKKAIEFYKKNGADKTFSGINNKDPAFVTKDLYLLAGSVKGGVTLVAHGANQKLIGKDMSQMKDTDGVYFAKQMVDVALSKDGNGWVDYRWPNPVSGKIEPKTTYVERVGDYYIACGIYK